MVNETVYLLGAGFSRSIGLCRIAEREFLPLLDVDANFFCALEEEDLLIGLLEDKPCLKLLLHWAGIYNKFDNKLRQVNHSLEKFWTQLNMMLKMNSSITGFPDLGIWPSKKSNGEKIMTMKKKCTKNAHNFVSIFSGQYQSNKVSRRDTKGFIFVKTLCFFVPLC